MLEEARLPIVQSSLYPVHAVLCATAWREEQYFKQSLFQINGMCDLVRPVHQLFTSCIAKKVLPPPRINAGRASQDIGGLRVREVQCDRRTNLEAWVRDLTLMGIRRDARLHR